MRSKNSRKEAFKVLGLTAATGAVGFATLQASPVLAAAAELTLPAENFAKLLQTDSADNPATPESTPLPSRAIAANSSPDDISALQTRLQWAALSNEKPSGSWTDETTAGVKKLQWKLAKKQTGKADAKTVKSLDRISTTNTIDKKCTQGADVLCVDKTQKVVRFVSEGKVVKAFHVNIGPEKGNKNFGRYSATREGQFKVGAKEKNSVSSLYGYSMPYWMQFDNGIGFHYSKYFDQASYKDASMGCVILGSKVEAKWLYTHSDVKRTKVVVYSS